MHNETFYLDGVDARSVGIKLQSPVEFSDAVPVVDIQSIPGRNGDLVWDTGSYENRSGSASCFCLQKDVEKALSAAGRFLMSGKGYRRLETSDDPDHFWMARVENSPEIAMRLRTLAPFSIDFDCKPQRFLKDGENTIVFTESGSLFNQYGQVALPLIAVYYKGNTTLIVGSATVELKSKWYHKDYLDQELQKYGLNIYVLSSNLNGIGVTSSEFYSALDDCNGNATQFVNNIKGYANSSVTDAEIASALALQASEYQQIFDDVVSGDWTNLIYLDSETQNAYDDRGVSQNMNINAPVFPKFNDGEIAISFESEIKRLEIIPRWWEV